MGLPEVKLVVVPQQSVEEDLVDVGDLREPLRQVLVLEDPGP